MYVHSNWRLNQDRKNKDGEIQKGFRIEADEVQQKRNYGKSPCFFAHTYVPLRVIGSVLAVLISAAVFVLGTGCLQPAKAHLR